MTGPFESRALWYYSSDGEYYRGGSLTKEEAEASAVADNPDQVYTIARCHDHVLKLSSFFDADDWLEQIEDHADDFQNESGDPIFDLTTQHIVELQAAVRATLDNFQVQRGLRFKSWYFFKVEEVSVFDPRPRCEECGEAKFYCYTSEPAAVLWQCLCKSKT